MEELHRREERDIFSSWNEEESEKMNSLNEKVGMGGREMSIEKKRVEGIRDLEYLGKEYMESMGEKQTERGREADNKHLGPKRRKHKPHYSKEMKELILKEAEREGVKATAEKYEISGATVTYWRNKQNLESTQAAEGGEGELEAEGKPFWTIQFNFLHSSTYSIQLSQVEYASIIHATNLLSALFN